METLEKILHSKKTKFKILNKLVPRILPPGVDTVEFFIDLNSVLNSFYNPQIIDLFKSLRSQGRYMFSSEILNIAAHYRYYFWSRHQMYTTFYFYYSDQPCKDLISIYPEYKRDFYMKRIGEDNPSYGNLNKILARNMKISNVIAEYLPHVYFINTGELDPNIVPYHFIKDLPDNALAVTLSNDQMALQNIFFHERSLVMTIKSDKSKFIDSEDVLSELSSSKKMRSYTFVPELLPFVLSISGVKKYNIPGLSGYGVVRACDMIQTWIDENVLSNVSYKDVDLFLEDVSKSKKRKLKEDQEEIIRRNFSLIDIPTIYSRVKQSDLVKFIDNQIVDKVDGRSLRYLNDKYYAKHPILLEEIMEGEDYS